MAIHNLFPQPVGMYKLERHLTEKEITFIKNQETCPNMGNDTRAQTKLRELNRVFLTISQITPSTK
jgi:hypothetical protein